MNIPRLQQLLRQGTFRILGTSVVDQVLLSAANFFVGVLLIRYTSDADYGYFVLAQAAVLLVSSAQGAWITGPLAVLAPKKSDAEARTMIGAVRQAQGRWLWRLSLLGVVLIGGGLLAGWLEQELAMVSLAGLLACWVGLQREYCRSVLQIVRQPGWVLLADVFYVVGLMATAALAALGFKPAAVWAVLPLAVGGLAGALVANLLIVRHYGWVEGDSAPVFRELRRLGNWAMLGAVIFWTYGQGFNYVTAAQLGVTAVAALNAARLLIQPTFVLSMGVKQALLPMASRWLADFGMAGLLRRLTGVVGVMLAMNLAYFWLAYTFLDWLTLSFLRKEIPDRDALVLLWGSYSLVVMVRDMFVTSLMAAERFQVLSGLTAATAVVALAVMWPAIEMLGTRGAVVGLLAGETFYSLVMFWLIAQSLRAERRANATTGADGQAASHADRG